MTTTLEHLTGLRLTQVLVAATVAALFLLATAGVASAAGSSYPTPEPPTRTHVVPAQPAPPPRVVGKPTVLPVTGGDAIGLAALGVGAAGVGAGLVVWSRRRSTAPVTG